MREIDLYTIKPHIGIGDVRFGASFAEIQQLIGEPDEVDREIPKSWITWKYKGKGIDLSFDSEDDHRLISIMTENQDSKFNGAPVIGLTELELFSLAQETDLGSHTREEFGGNLGYQIEFPKFDIEFVFDPLRPSITSTILFVSWRVKIGAGDLSEWPEESN